ncbi:hypothetical protein O6H91_10G028300 [Diphasiastrum complanatum]|uniref:Uncharacterized protein n=5 Tax=Diphasiastrum complanatum TaxID=34168 RepID=A0ACC2CFF8_DIPCM|nr:hypothetical protein O6H91_10G028300 [Diphasiastrum complanatum]KAJ7540731.1 hypothetical protein O6H91_10G028300 [Diphasiastrum complanatum]KAJ7540732.1 hypothetical protein O6H91_10G028300 [Diphasiastrum complanatum]KAJ7540733.1 hypothetical protein O6H91_10G028300 [Diphasiastrum complanatum]KAJ7540734.1 hypothetical protein O6H91_10G028300 [Diphasiastrum complanatum]
MVYVSGSYRDTTSKSFTSAVCLRSRLSFSLGTSGNHISALNHEPATEFRRKRSERIGLAIGSSKPHKANDAGWEVISALKSREGSLGLSHFKIVKRLGCGDIGSVYLAELRGTSCYFAIKVMDKGALVGRNKLLRSQTEREILESLDHPFLPTLYTYFDTSRFSCLVMEYCPGGDLHNLRQCQPGKRFDNAAARFYAAEVLLALEYLHMLGVVYRDLKPENVLVRADGHIMLSDFDLSMKCDVNPTLVHSSTNTLIVCDSKRRSRSSCMPPSSLGPCSKKKRPAILSCVPFVTKRFNRLFNKENHKGKVAPLPELIVEPTSARSMSFVGTHEYLAPEIISGGGHGSAVDWWTFGIFLYELLYGRSPFKGEDNESTLLNVLSKPLRFPDHCKGVSESAKSLIKGLLVKDPEKRLASARGAADIKQHPFFEGLNWALIRCTVPPEIPSRDYKRSVDVSDQQIKPSINTQNTSMLDDHLPEAKKKIWIIHNTIATSVPNFDYF